jgi:aminobenzoyl-glutamate transport protein
MTHRSATTPLQRALDLVERIGNALPHPASLFVGLSCVVIVLSWTLSALGVSATHPLTGATVTPSNLLSTEGLQRLILNFVPNFVTFAPFGPVVVSLLGLSVAERAGLLGAVVRVIVGRLPGRALTVTVVFAGAMSHTVGDVGYVLLLPLSAALFHTAGRHPIAGLAASFMGVSGGFAANLLLSPTDVILAGLTQEAARLVDPTYVVSPLASYYFLAASVLLVTTTGTLVTRWIVEPRLGAYTGTVTPEAASPLTRDEWRGLMVAGVITAMMAAAVVWGLQPGGVLSDPERPGFVGSYFLRGLVFFIFMFGVVPGLAYGITAGTLRRDADVYKGMQANMELVAGYLVLVFFIAQFISIFSWSNLAVIAAVSGAATVKAAGLGSIPLLLAVIGLTATIDLFLGSASAKWALLGPVLIPMFMLLGYAPELTQTAYRVGDSLTNIITPLSSNFPLVLMFLQRYEPKAGIGTLTATMLPYTLTNAVVWPVMLILWVLLGLSTGPGAPLFYGAP